MTNANNAKQQHKEQTMKKAMTVADLAKKLNQLIRAGEGNATVLLFSDAEGNDIHKVDTIEVDMPQHCVYIVPSHGSFR